MSSKKMLNIKNWKMLIIVMMCFVVASTFMVYPRFVKNASAVTIQEQKNQLKDVNEKKSKTQEQEKEVTERILSKAKEVESIEASIKEQSVQIQSTHNEIDKKKEELKKKKDDLEIRLRTIYKKGSVGFVEVILNSKNVSELISNMSFMQKIYKSDKAAITSVKKDQAKLQSIEQRLKEEEKTLSAKKQESIEAKKSLEEERAEIDKKLKQYQAQAEQIGNEIASAQAAIEANERARQNAAGQGNSSTPAAPDSGYTSGTGQLGWPVRGSVICGFGYRPIFGDFHTGIDIPVPTGTPVHAADSGTVLLTGYMPSGYGNYLVIYHGNDISTLYAHNSSLAVSQGQSVSKGQVVAYSGSTGWSTGPHCHFEVRVNRIPVNPMGYL